MDSNQLSAISDQSLTLLEESETLLAAAEEFVEAVQRSKRMKRKEQIARRLELALRKAFREQGRQFERALRKFRDRFGEAQVGQTQGQPLQEAILPIEWMFVFHAVAQKTVRLFSAPIDDAAQKALLAGALNEIANLGLKISFTLANPKAVAYLEQYGAKLVKKIDETTRDYIQTVLEQASREGWSYDRTAEAIIERYEEFAIGKPQAHIDSRAHLIAVTESGNAYTEGQLQIALDMKAAGLPMEKYWSTVGDNKVSDGCLENEAADWIEIEQLFPSGHQRPLRFPGCRCDLLTRMKE